MSLTCFNKQSCHLGCWCSTRGNCHRILQTHISSHQLEASPKKHWVNFWNFYFWEEANEEISEEKIKRENWRINSQSWTGNGTLNLHRTELQPCDKLRKRENLLRIFLPRDVSSHDILSCGALQELEQQLLNDIPAALENSPLEHHSMGLTPDSAWLWLPSLFRKSRNRMWQALIPFKANSWDRKDILEMTTKLLLTSKKIPPAVIIHLKAQLKRGENSKRCPATKVWMGETTGKDLGASYLFLYIYTEKVFQIWLDRFVFFNKLQLRERQKPLAVLDLLLHI